VKVGVGSVEPLVYPLIASGPTASTGAGMEISASDSNGSSIVSAMTSGSRLFMASWKRGTPPYCLLPEQPQAPAANTERSGGTWGRSTDSFPDGTTAPHSQSRTFPATTQRMNRTCGAGGCPAPPVLKSVPRHPHFNTGELRRTVSGARGAGGRQLFHRTARAVSSERLLTVSFWKMCERWAFTVPREMNIRSPI
jgi:hypothetical protein